MSHPEVALQKASSEETLRFIACLGTGGGANAGMGNEGIENPRMQLCGSIPAGSY